MYLSESLQKKWEAVLDHPELPKIADPYRKAVTAVVLENQAAEMIKSGQMLYEATPANAAGTGGFGGSAAAGGPVAGFDPILISLVRRSLPNLIAYDICGVQPMTGPTGLIFAMRSSYSTANVTAGATEAFYNEVNTGFGGIAGAQNALTVGSAAANTFVSNAAACTAMTTATAENLTFNEMAFSIEKVTVTAGTRALKAEYSIELAQDMKSVHGLDAEGELSNILSAEILTEINREVVRTVYRTAKVGAAVGTATAGTFDLDVDSNGRWSVEKFKGLMFQIEREANAIGQQTRRGRGNIIITSADVASALAMAGVLDYQSGLTGKNDLTVDDTSTTFAGVLNGKYKVYVDPYAANISANQYFVVGYKGTSAFDAGLFYCPYVPLQMVRAVDPNSFQPKIGFKTRYGLVANPFVDLDDGSGNTGDLTANQNYYYRRVKVTNLM